MKTMMKILAVLAVLMLTFSPQITASADVSKFKGHGAYAYFKSTDGCIQTIVMIELGEESLQYIELSRVDTCLDQTLFTAYGNKVLSKSELKYTGNLKSAELATTVNVYDTFSRSSFDVFIDIAWRGTGEILVLQNHNNYEPWPGCQVTVQSKEKYRDSQVTGTVSDGATNFTPDPAIDDNLFFTNSKSISHGCE